MTWLLSLLGGSASGIVGYLLTGLAAIIGILMASFVVERQSGRLGHQGETTLAIF